MFLNTLLKISSVFYIKLINQHEFCFALFDVAKLRCFKQVHGKEFEECGVSIDIL